MRQWVNYPVQKQSTNQQNQPVQNSIVNRLFASCNLHFRKAIQKRQRMANMFMKRYVKCSLLFVGLSLLSAASSMAFETAVGVGATAITSVPYTINTSGNYYLAANLSVSSPVGAAIIVNASQVILDLNGRTLSSTAGTGFGVGIYVANQLDVTIQNGDIDGFQYGVYLAPNSTDNNMKNVVDNVRFNDNGIGVLCVRGH